MMRLTMLAAATGFVACASDDPDATGNDPAGRTADQEFLVLEVVSGWTEKDQSPIDPDGDLSKVQANDGDWWPLEGGYFSSFTFDAAAVPTDVDIVGITVVAEHWDEEELALGDLTLGVATGLVDAPDLTASTDVPLRPGEAEQGPFAWAADADLDGLVVVLTNANAEGKKSQLNHLFVEVDIER
ncbi:MAG: hypothetical protein AAF211_28175 [Myxococcota bacterium]